MKIHPRHRQAAMLLGLIACTPQTAISDVSPDASPPPVDAQRAQRYHMPGGAQILAPLPQMMPLTAVASGGRSSVYEADEVVTLQASDAEAKRADLLMHMSAGRLLRRRALPALNLIVSTYRVPYGADLPARIREIVDSTPELLADLNHRYRLSSDDVRSQAYFAQRIGWSPALTACARDRAVGMIDTPIALDHPALRHARIQTFSAIPAGVAEAPADHGTAVASLLVGDAGTARFGGLIPQARLFAAQVFRNDDDEAQASAEWLALALDWLVAQRVEVINMSLGGPENRVLARALEEAMARGVVIVAAAGNGGRSAERPYPAAWAPVIAVTAVDAELLPYPQAQQGAYIDFAAPGVDVWAATAAGTGRFHSGTSFATPFVTAAVAAIGRGAESRLVAHARDLGPPGHDPQFGHGFIQAVGCDRQQSPVR